MIVPEGVKVYGPGKQVIKAGNELPIHMKHVEKSITVAGEKYANRKKGKKVKDENLDKGKSGDNSPDKNLFGKK